VDNSKAKITSNLRCIGL